MTPKGGYEMKTIGTITLLALVTALACAQTITITGIGTIDSIPKATYTMYFYVAPTTERLRAVFLKIPDADVEIIPYSVQTTTVTGTVDDALTFLEHGTGIQSVTPRMVTFRGRKIGYLLAPERHMFSNQYIDVNIYERNGRIYFNPAEIGMEK